MIDIRVLYIGVYRDSTGWSNMAINSMLALDAAGVDVVARPVKLNRALPVLPDKILEFEGKPHRKYDAVIQNVLPHMTDYNGRIPLNIAYICTETSSIANTNWPAYLNCMDQTWVCCHQSKTCVNESGVKVPKFTIPIACDISKYQKKYNTLSIRDKLGDSFIFYYIGDFNKRKNISALIRAFHSEFDVNEPVNLVIKTNIGTGSNDPYKNMQDREQVMHEIGRIKEAMKLYPSIDQYKQEIVLVGQYTDEEIMRLHASCDCFVCPSYGEAWSIPAFDAMAMGKTPIVTRYTGFSEYLSFHTGWLVNTYAEPVFSMQKFGLPNMFTSNEYWLSVDIFDLRHCMREAYKCNEDRKEKSLAGFKRAHDFSYDKVGRRMVEVINEGLHQ